jgi:hypothetical protein
MYSKAEVDFVEDPLLLNQDNIRFSFSSDSVSFSDWNAGQVDFYFMKATSAENYIKEMNAIATTGAATRVNEVSVGGVMATSIERVDYLADILYKGGEGGSLYLIKLNNSEYLIIRQQPFGYMGDKKLQRVFSYYLQTADFTSVSNY